MEICCVCGEYIFPGEESVWDGELMHLKCQESERADAEFMWMED